VPLQVNVQREDGSFVQAVLDAAQEKDMYLEQWMFRWRETWDSIVTHNHDFFGFTKLSVDGETLGLIKVGILPICTLSSPDMKYLQIFILETIPSKTVRPVGKWLIWYACHLAGILCTGNDKGSIVEVHSAMHTAFYYNNRIGMEDLGYFQPPEGQEISRKFVTFGFNRQQAKNFCEQLQEQYGKPRIPTDWEPKYN
jgi:hypothetical protein